MRLSTSLLPSLKSNIPYEDFMIYTVHKGRDVGVSVTTMANRVIILRRQEGSLVQLSSQNWFRLQTPARWFILGMFKHDTIW